MRPAGRTVGEISRLHRALGLEETQPLTTDIKVDLALNDRCGTPCEVHDDGKGFLKTNKWIGSNPIPPWRSAGGGTELPAKSLRL